MDAELREVGRPLSDCGRAKKIGQFTALNVLVKSFTLERPFLGTAARMRLAHGQTQAKVPSPFRCSHGARPSLNEARGSSNSLPPSPVVQSLLATCMHRSSLVRLQSVVSAAAAASLCPCPIFRRMVHRLPDTYLSMIQSLQDVTLSREGEGGEKDGRSIVSAWWHTHPVALPGGDDCCHHTRATGGPFLSPLTLLLSLKAKNTNTAAYSAVTFIPSFRL